jgi:hypothetical protein
MLLDRKRIKSKSSYMYVKKPLMFCTHINKVYVNPSLVAVSVGLKTELINE